MQGPIQLSDTSAHPPKLHSILSSYNRRPTSGALLSARPRDDEDPRILATGPPAVCVCLVDLLAAHAAILSVSWLYEAALPTAAASVSWLASCQDMPPGPVQR